MPHIKWCLIVDVIAFFTGTKCIRCSFYATLSKSAVIIYFVWFQSMVEEFFNENPDLGQVEVNELCCKTGNKVFSLQLRGARQCISWRHWLPKPRHYCQKQFHISCTCSNSYWVVSRNATCYDAQHNYFYRKCVCWSSNKVKKFK